MLAQQILTILLKIHIHIHEDTVWSLNIIYNIGLYMVTDVETSPIGLPKPGSAIICQSELNQWEWRNISAFHLVAPKTVYQILCFIINN